MEQIINQSIKNIYFFGIKKGAIGFPIAPFMVTCKFIN